MYQKRSLLSKTLPKNFRILTRFYKINCYYQDCDVHIAICSLFLCYFIPLAIVSHGIPLKVHYLSIILYSIIWALYWFSSRNVDKGRSGAFDSITFVCSRSALANHKANCIIYLLVHKLQTLFLLLSQKQTKYNAKFMNRSRLANRSRPLYK